MKQPTTVITGSCHCGNLSFELKTVFLPTTLTVRNCQCSFCKAHGAATARDPDGNARIMARDANEITLYRFATKSTDFILCAICGVYVGATITHAQSKYATLNMNLTDIDISGAEPIIHEDDTGENRLASRVELFTPVVSYPFG